MPSSSTHRYRNAHAKVLTRALSTAAAAPRAHHFRVTTVFRPPRFLTVSGMWTLSAWPSAAEVQGVVQVWAFGRVLELIVGPPPRDQLPMTFASSLGASDQQMISTLECV